MVKSFFVVGVFVTLVASGLHCRVVSAAAVQPEVYSIPFVTLRHINSPEKPASYYGDDRGAQTQGNCSVASQPNGLLSSIGDYVDFYVPSGDAEITAIHQEFADTFWENIKHKLNGEKPIVYVHGYNISFEKACLRATQLAQNLGLEHRIILFSWPSDGATLNYIRDEADIAWSILPLANFFGELSEHVGADGFDIIAHSLGTRGVVLALSRLTQQSSSLNLHVDQLVLMASDMDAARATQHMPELVKLTKKVTLYTSDNDRALTISENLHGYPRLGQSGDHLSQLEGVDIIDVSELRVRRMSGHLYHLANEVVITDLRELLEEKRPAASRTNIKPDAQINGWQLVLPRDK